MKPIFTAAFITLNASLQLASASSTELEQKIISVKERRATINIATMYTSPVGVRHRPDFDFDAVESPFPSVPVIEKSKEISPASSGAKPIVIEDTPRGILIRISQKLKPSGSILQGDRYILMFGKHFVHEGGSINASYQGKAYKIYIEDITENTFSMRLDDVIIERTIEDNSTQGFAKPANI